MKALKVIIPIGVLLTLTLAGLFWLKDQQAKKNGDGLAGQGTVVLGGPIPKLSLTDYSDNSKSIHLEKLPHKVVLLNFWATWCEACMVEMPSIIALREAYKDKGFEVLALNVDEDPQTAVPRVIKDLNFNFPLFVDLDGEASAAFGVHAIPFTVIMDLKKNKVLYMQSGERDWNSSEMRSQLDQWLAE